MEKGKFIERSIEFGFIYGNLLLLVLMKGQGYQIDDLLSHSTVTEILIVGIVFWIVGGVFVSIYIYQFNLSKTYTEFYRRIVNIFIVLTIVIFTSEVLDFYWIAVHKNSKFYSCILSGLFFSPIFIGISLIFQKIFLYLKKGHDISYPEKRE